MVRLYSLDVSNASSVYIMEKPIKKFVKKKQFLERIAKK